MELLDEYMLDDIVEHLSNREKIKMMCCSKKYKNKKITVYNAKFDLDELTRMIDDKLWRIFDIAKMGISFRYLRQDTMQIEITTKNKSFEFSVAMETFICSDIIYIFLNT